MFDDLVSQHGDAMMRSIWRITGNSDAADDVLQSSLLAIWLRIEYVSGHPNPRAVALRICIDNAWDYRRANLLTTLDLDLSRVETPEPSVARRFELAESLELLVKSIESLPSQQRTAIWMRCVEQSSYEEIAAVMQCSTATVRKHVEKARTKLKENTKLQINDV